MTQKQRILVIGCGHMGRSHALSYEKLDGFEIAGFVTRSRDSFLTLPENLQEYPHYSNLDLALESLSPDGVSINTYPDTHAEYAIKSMQAGCHVFLEKPLGVTNAEAELVVETAKQTGKKLVIGYILRHHPSWARFVEIGKTLGKPLVMRMNLNQQSSGSEWNTHKNLMNAVSPIVDCGVHYVDIMCLTSGSKPVSVHAIGANLSAEINDDMYNYGQLQVKFADGSVGWYEAGWGPMMSNVATFVKDIVGPEGCVSIAEPAPGKDSANVDDHTKTSTLIHHKSKLDEQGNMAEKDEVIDMAQEPGHQELCDFEQEFFLKAIQEDMDLSDHMDDALNSLKIVLAADESIRTRQVVEL